MQDKMSTGTHKLNESMVASTKMINLENDKREKTAEINHV